MRWNAITVIMDYEFEPMDVDLSGNSIYQCDEMDISLDRTISEFKVKEEPLETVSKQSIKNILASDSKTELITATPSMAVTKRYTIKLPQRKPHKKISNTALSIIFGTLPFLALLIYHILNFECSGELHLEAIKKLLNKNVIGQQQAIEQIIESLEEKNSHPSKILLLYGGTGVGKTFTISLILQNLHKYANIYHYTMPSFVDTFSTDLMLGRTFCPTCIIVVDDLNSIDMHVTEHIKKMIEKSENLGKSILIILIFNCDTINDNYIKKCHDSFHLELEQAFKELKALKRFIKFNSLTEDHLRRCIEKEMGDANLSEGELKNIAKHFNVSVDGCKGVYTKIKLLNNE